MTRDEQLLDTWAIQNRVTLRVLDAVSDEGLASASRSRARNVADQIAHVHSVRVMWLEAAAPQLAKSLRRFQKGEAGDRAELRAALEASAEAVSEVLRAAFESGKVKGSKLHPAAFFGYLLAHEAHHRGQALLTLELAGHGLPRDLGHAIWDWDRI